MDGWACTEGLRVVVRYFVYPKPAANKNGEPKEIEFADFFLLVGGHPLWREDDVTAEAWEAIHGELDGATSGKLCEVSDRAHELFMQSIKAVQFPSGAPSWFMRHTRVVTGASKSKPEPVEATEKKVQA